MVIVDIGHAGRAGSSAPLGPSHTDITTTSFDDPSTRQATELRPRRPGPARTERKTPASLHSPLFIRRVRWQCSALVLRPYETARTRPQSDQRVPRINLAFRCLRAASRP